MANSQFSVKQIAESAKRSAENAAAGRSPDVIRASSRPGELAQQFSFGGEVIPGISGAAGKLAGAAGKLGGAAGKLGGAVGSQAGAAGKRAGSAGTGIFQNPVKPIALGVLVVLWLVLGLLGPGGGLTGILSWITFAQGGLYRSLPGLLGGILGKGTVAAALLSLLDKNGISRVTSGLGALPAALKEKGAVVKALPGIVLAVVLYLIFVGPSNVSAGNTMAGIAGALLSLRALGGAKDALSGMVKSRAMRAGLALGFAGISILSVLF